MGLGEMRQCGRLWSPGEFTRERLRIVKLRAIVCVVPCIHK